MIDIMCLRQSYKQRKIMKIKCIYGNSNLADAIIKAKPMQGIARLNQYQYH